MPSIEFKELEIDKARHLSTKLGFDLNLNSPMTLTEIYNQSESDFRQAQKNNLKGFRTLNRPTEN